MIELTDLEIAEEIAKIKGFNFDFKFSKGTSVPTVITSDGISIRYNPLSNKNNCKLRDEFNVEIDYDQKLVEVRKDSCTLSQIAFINKKDINKAVCLAIIEAYR